MPVTRSLMDGLYALRSTYVRRSRSSLHAEVTSVTVSPLACIVESL